MQLAFHVYLGSLDRLLLVCPYLHGEREECLLWHRCRRRVLRYLPSLRQISACAWTHAVLRSYHSRISVASSSLSLAFFFLSSSWVLPAWSAGERRRKRRRTRERRRLWSVRSRRRCRNECLAKEIEGRGCTPLLSPAPPPPPPASSSSFFFLRASFFFFFFF